MPTLPPDLGGGPITDLTRGMLWAAAGLDGGQKPSLEIVVATPSADASKDVLRLGKNLIAFPRKSPQVQNTIRNSPSYFRISSPKSPLTGSRSKSAPEGRRDDRCGPGARAVRGDVNPVRQQPEATRSGLHNYHRRHNAFPPAFSSSKDGKPLLSWRVLILPFLDQNSLYQEFHVDEPWDSPHNRALVAKMPAVYRCPFEGRDMAAQGKTRVPWPRAGDWHDHAEEASQSASARSPTARQIPSSLSMPRTTRPSRGQSPETWRSTRRWRSSNSSKRHRTADG